MNSEMLPLILFLLYSDELQKQSDRIIQALSNQNGSTNGSSTGTIIEEIKMEETVLLNSTREYLALSYQQIIDEIKISSDPKRITAELSPALTSEQKAFYHKTLEHMDKQHASLIRELRHPDSKEIADEIISSLKSDENEIFERAANHVYMYYSGIIEEIKGSQKFKHFSEEISSTLKGNSDMILKSLKEFINETNQVVLAEMKQNNNAGLFAEDLIAHLSNAEWVQANLQFQKAQLHSIDLIKESISELKVKIESLAGPSSTEPDRLKSPSKKPRRDDK